MPHPNSDIRTPSSTVNSASKTLDLATGEWMQCTMVNTAQLGQVVWSKVDDAGNPLAGTVFTLASPALNGGQKEVTDCVATGGKATCPNGSVDQDPRAGFFRDSGLTWGEYSLTETQAPTGYHMSGTTLTKTLDGSAPAAGNDDATPTLDLGQVINSRIKGSATWTKTDEGGHAIKGAQWSLIPLDSNGRPQPDRARTITDCVGTCAQGSLDTDGNPGAFKLAELGYGSYGLMETKPPTGYILDATPRTITISSQGQVVALGDLEVVRVMRRRDLDRAGTLLRIRIGVRDDRNFLTDQRQDNLPADNRLVAFVIRMYCDRLIGEHGLRSGGRDDDTVEISGRLYSRIFEVPILAVLILVLDLRVRERCAALRTPVDQTVAAIDQTLLI